jgi:hypothetical protein
VSLGADASLRDARDKDSLDNAVMAGSSKVANFLEQVRSRQVLLADCQSFAQGFF